jgi:hypothetical protein
VALAREVFLFCELDTVRVKGHPAALNIFEPLAAHAALWETLAMLRRDETLGQPHQDAWAANPASVIARRARRYADQPLEPAWCGVWIISGA